MFKRLMLVGSVLAPLSMFADSTVESEITSALSSGATTATTLLVAAVAIPLAFLVFKIGKRVIGKA